MPKLTAADIDVLTGAVLREGIQYCGVCGWFTGIGEGAASLGHFRRTCKGCGANLSVGTCRMRHAFGRCSVCDSDDD